MRTGRQARNPCRLFLWRYSTMAIHTLSIDVETFSMSI